MVKISELSMDTKLTVKTVWGYVLYIYILCVRGYAT